MNIDTFKQQHVDLFRAITALRELAQLGVKEHAEGILQLMVSISTAIKLHLAAEDRVLYPALTDSSDPVTAQTGRRFQQEMGGLAAAYGVFARPWNRVGKIAGNPQGFKDGANIVFKALHERVQRENRELYPLAERV